MQCRDVTETDHDLRIGRDLVVVKPVKEPRQSVSASPRKDGFHFRIGKRRHQFRRPLFIGTGQVTPFPVQFVRHFHRKPHGLEPLASPLHAFPVQRSRGRDEHDRIPRPQTLRTHAVVQRLVTESRGREQDNEGKETELYLRVDSSWRLATTERDWRVRRPT